MSGPQQHTCGRCGKPACYGFKLPHGQMWACTDHRDDAEHAFQTAWRPRRKEDAA